MKPYEKLQKFWACSGAQIPAGGVSEVDVQDLELRYELRFPHDFREYLLHLCPRHEGGGDDCATTWWHLDRIKNIPAECDRLSSNDVIARDASRYVFFGDYAIWCMAWAICCDNGLNRGKIAVISGRDRFVADDFAQFVDLYIQDVQQLI